MGSLNASSTELGWVFPSKTYFSRPKWDKLGWTCYCQFFPSKTGKNYISSSKTFLKCDYQTKIEQDMLEDNLTKELWAHKPKFVKKVVALILIQIIYSGFTMLMSHQLWCQACPKFFLCKNKMYRIWIMNSHKPQIVKWFSLTTLGKIRSGWYRVQQADINSKVNFMFSHHLWIKKN